MTIAEFVGGCVEPRLLEITLFNVDDETVTWRGTADNIPNELLFERFESFDVPNNDEICINYTKYF